MSKTGYGRILRNNAIPSIMGNYDHHDYGKHLTNQHYLSITDALWVIMLITGQ